MKLSAKLYKLNNIAHTTVMIWPDFYVNMKKFNGKRYEVRIRELTILRKRIAVVLFE